MLIFLYQNLKSHQPCYTHPFVFARLTGSSRCFYINFYFIFACPAFYIQMLTFCSIIYDCKFCSTSRTFIPFSFQWRVCYFLHIHNLRECITNVIIIHFIFWKPYDILDPYNAFLFFTVFYHTDINSPVHNPLFNLCAFR